MSDPTPITKCAPGPKKALERTLILLKPDCMERRLAGAVLDRFQKAGLHLVACKMLVLSPLLLRTHYAHLAKETFYINIENFMRSRPIIAAILEGGAAIEHVRTLLGATDPAIAETGTIRSDWGTDKMRNLCHASDSPQNAEAEIRRFFKPEEIF